MLVVAVHVRERYVKRSKLDAMSLRKGENEDGDEPLGRCRVTMFNSRHDQCIIETKEEFKNKKKWESDFSAAMLLRVNIAFKQIIYRESQPRWSGRPAAALNKGSGRIW